VDRTRVYWLLPGMDRRIGFAENVNGTNTFYYYLTDQVGTVLRIVKEDGTVVNQYDYDAFGRVRQASPNTFATVENRYLFQGREWDKNGGFYYFRNRIYLPERGEFASPDMNLGRGILGEMDGMATLTFCGGDPVNCIDPTGLMPDNDFSFDMKIAIVTAKDRGMTISEAIDEQQKLQTSVANKSIPVFVGLGAACFGGAAIIPYVSEGALGYFTVGAFSAGVEDAASQVTEKVLGTRKSYSLERTMWMANLGGVLSVGGYYGSRLIAQISSARMPATEVGPTIQNAEKLNPLAPKPPPGVNSTTSPAGVRSSTTPLCETVNGVSDDAVVSFRPNAYSVIKPGKGGEIFAFRYRDIKHLSPRKVETVIGPLSNAGLTGGARVMHVLGEGLLDRAVKQPGAVVYEIPEYIFYTELSVERSILVQ